MSMATSEKPDRLLGESPAFLQVMEEVSRAAPLDRPVLVVGERGTGKELIAARLHFLSRRWDGPYEKLNCAAISDTLLESELFGHESGAFTGAQKRRIGRFERADGGTLFLDELATTSNAVQEKILRLVEYGELERLGAERSLKVDVRLVAATNEDLPTLADAGRFRADLLDRLAFDVITLPPLRARRDDILLLAEHFGIAMALSLDREFFPGFTPAARERLLKHGWPGNIRELRNVVERAVYRSEPPDEPIEEISFDPFDSPWRPAAGPAIEPATSASGTRPPADSPAAEAAIAAPPAPVTDFREAVRNYEVGLLEAALLDNQHNQRRTAEQLGLTYDQLRGYLRKYELGGASAGRTREAAE